jgi:hypothetical protein
MSLAAWGQAHGDAWRRTHGMGQQGVRMLPAGIPGSVEVKEGKSGSSVVRADPSFSMRLHEPTTD